MRFSTGSFDCWNTRAQRGQRLRVLSQFRQRHGEQGVEVRQRGLELERSPKRRHRRRKLALLEIHQAEPRVDLGDRGLLLPQLLVGAFRIRVPAFPQRAFACLVERAAPRWPRPAGAPVCAPAATAPRRTLTTTHARETFQTPLTRSVDTPWSDRGASHPVKRTMLAGGRVEESCRPRTGRQPGLISPGSEHELHAELIDATGRAPS